jgi:hypothetical protein
MAIDVLSKNQPQTRIFMLTDGQEDNQYKKNEVI